MRLTRIRVQNLRAVQDLTVRLRDYSSLIGPNNSGKSTILRAIELLLNNVNPSIDEMRKGEDDQDITIEAEFGDILDRERATPGIASLVYDASIKLRRCISIGDDGKAKSTFQCYKCPETIDGWSDKWGELAPEIKTLASDHIEGFNGTKFKSSNSKEQVKELIKKHQSERIIAGDTEWTNEGFSIPAALQQALPQAQIIPAVRDAADDAKPGAKTSFGLLLKKVVLPAMEESKEYKELLDAVGALEQRLRSTGDDQLPQIRSLTDEIATNLRGLMDAKVQIGMAPPDAEKFVGTNTILRLDDGTETPVELQGHGLQRALVFALLEILARQNADVTKEGEESRVRSTVLLYEEPELFIHPYLIRRLKDAFEAIAIRSDWQVVVTTHSPFMVNVGNDPQSLVIHRRLSNESAPEVTQLDHDPFEGDDGLIDERKRPGLLTSFQDAGLSCKQLL